ncbi:hypothetical protein FB45DRAFT_1032743 [Roridomyces roridus]|uniref:Uncharacterized protein n=1 Tax=Roridomyces roridus TaxID=1738132 RepID=A0AAD7F9W3_9AGAR|nr:hypothetical protein FB45DRAFT_1040500 [Roridomyces roridus]KAJ7621493.1 hypothetical protein FB45DRAFT_1032743 [Roridomyces roridus]
MEPSFPLELEREIFETAALSYPETIPRLLLVAVLEVATETQSLVLLGSDLDFESLSNRFTLSKLERLASSMQGLTKKLELADMYITLTHLDLFHSDWPSVIISEICHLPALTHLALCDDCEIAAAVHVLSNCARIAVLIYMNADEPKSDYDDEREILLDDDRFLTMAIGTDEYMRDWFDFKIDSWTLA